MKNKTIHVIIRWALVIAWAGVIYWFSAQNATDSAEMSGGLSQFLLKLLGNFMSEEALDALLRECAHFGIFAIEGFLMYLALMDARYRLLCAWGICVPLAIADEIHQLFSEGRAFQLMDIGIDSLGALAGVLVAKFIVTALRHFSSRRRVFHQ